MLIQIQIYFILIYTKFGISCLNFYLAILKNIFQISYLNTTIFRFRRSHISIRILDHNINYLKLFYFQNYFLA